MLKISITFIFIISLSCGFVNAQVPQMINYQGVLSDADGMPVTDTLTIEFTIYDSEDLSAIPIWSEIHEDITVMDGRFNIVLGSVLPIPYSVFTGEVRYLGISVDSDPEMMPRKKLVSVGYCMHSYETDKLDGRDAADFLQSIDGVASSSSGNVDLVGGDNVTITPAAGNHKITISASGGTGGDDLGNHSATRNIRLNSHWLSNDGGDEGIQIDNNGNVIITNGRLQTGTPASDQGGSGDIISTNNVIADENVRATKSLIAEEGVYASAGAGNSDYGVWSTKNTSNTFGLLATSRYGVLGQKDGTAGYLASDNYGVYGHTQGGGIGYLGSANYGAYGQYGDGKYGLLGSKSYAVYGAHSGHYGFLCGTNYAVYGENNSGARGGLGYNNIGARGEWDSNHWGYLGSAYWGGYIKGDFRVEGEITKLSGGFIIDHPLDPANKFLVHSFVESPDMKNIYDGVVLLDANGEAWIELPQWFDALNENIRYQLTAIGEPAPNLHIAEEITDNRFKIAGGKTGMKVSWQVTGIRQDDYARANRMQVEVEKNDRERGKYLTPVEHGIPATMGISYEQTKLLNEERISFQKKHLHITEESKRLEEKLKRAKENNEGL